MELSQMIKGTNKVEVVDMTDDRIEKLMKRISVLEKSLATAEHQRHKAEAIKDQAVKAFKLVAPMHKPLEFKTDDP
jgi:hypothetical protein